MNSLRKFLTQPLNEKKVVKDNLNSNNLDKSLSLIDSFQLSEDSYNKILQFINKKLKEDKKTKKINLIIISNYTKKVFEAKIIENFLKKKILVNILYLDFNTVFLNKIKIKNKNSNIFLIYCGHDDLIKFSNYNNNSSYKNVDINNVKNCIEKIISIVSQNINSKIFISNFSNFSNSEFGNFVSLVKKNKFELISKLNRVINKLIDKYNVYLIDNYNISNQFGLKNLEVKEKYYLAKIPFSLDFADYYFYNLSNLASISLGNTKKVLVLDLDNTLWGGVLGDDGYNGIEIGNDTPIGNVYYDFQKEIKNLKKRGVLLAICSKNSLLNVKEVFKKNRNMILKYSDFVCVKANWQNKHKNILEISKELNLSLDSFVFIDDSPMERDMVRENLPEVSTPELPLDPSFYKDIMLDRLYFDVTNLSSEDKKRSKSYLTESKRISLRNKLKSDDEYFYSLKMKANLKNFSLSNIDRIVQLFQRSNQFNLTTIRYSHLDIKNLIKNKNFTLEVSFKDKFSDYGIISLLVCEKIKNNLYIKNWVMSCRVLNRSLEKLILNTIMNYCKKNKIKNLLGTYIRSKKNALVENLYCNLGFDTIKSKKNFKNYISSVNNYQIKKTFIKLEN